MDARRLVDQAVRSALTQNPRLLLAVSGGLDSMVLLHAVARAGTATPAGIVVATFDHGTGPAATVAADLVADEATRLGFAVRRGRAALPDASEAEWRSARWRFLRTEAARAGAAVVTAHTRDDQVETVVLRALRGAGPRGLAALYAQTGVVRPFLELPRHVLAAYAAAERVPYREDPTNTSPAYLRNRVRNDLLPAIRRVRPQFDAELLDLARRAADWRSAVDALAARFLLDTPRRGELRVARPKLATYDSTALRVLWPAILARVGVTADRRGTLRLAQFTTSGSPGARIQLSGDYEVLRDRDTFLVHRPIVGDTIEPRPLAGPVEFGNWRFTPIPASESGHRKSDHAPVDGTVADGSDLWIAEFPRDCKLIVRAWRSGDRMGQTGGRAARRVKRFFSDARIPGPAREGWPVVEADGELAWIPGVRRGSAATERSGRPVTRYRCERIDG